MQIRQAKLADSHCLINFNQAMAQETENLTLDGDTLEKGVLGMLQHPERGFYLVAEIDGQVVGSLMVTFEWSDWRAQQYYWIQSVYILPAFRRQGIYSALYKQVKIIAAEKSDGDCFRLYVEHDNQRAQRTYEALGMKQSHYLMYEE
ncbi:GNAT family N-acetyltransferase [Shewanella maritima]|uniref:GNAT family N-acetyltransferase n=1 Tax=Shewanella maritima TaxID=2520507 RepID=UPI003735C6CC